MKRICEWVKLHWQQRIFRTSTLFAIVLLYLELFHPVEIKHFLNYLFMDAGRKLIDHIVSNDSFITYLIAAVCGYLGWTKRF